MADGGTAIATAVGHPQTMAPCSPSCLPEAIRGLKRGSHGPGGGGGAGARVAWPVRSPIILGGGVVWRRDMGLTERTNVTDRWRDGRAGRRSSSCRDASTLRKSERRQTEATPQLPA